MSADITKKFNEIDGLLKKEAYSEAEQVCKNLLSNNPNNLDVLLKLGEIQINIGEDDYTHALSTFNKLSKISPKNPIFLSHLARIYSIQEKYPEAKSTIDLALKEDPNCALAWAVKGFILSDADNDYKEAFECYDKALSIDNSNYQLWYWYGWRRGEWNFLESAIENFTKANALQPNNSVILYSMGYFQEQAGLYKEALKSAEKCLEINPNRTDARRIIGTSLGKMGKYEEAIQELEIIRDELNKGDLWLLGAYYYHLKNYKSSLAIYEKMIKDNPDELTLLTSAGSNLVELKEPEKALEYCNRVVSLRDEDGFAHLNIVKSYRLLGKSDDANKYLMEKQNQILVSQLVRHPEPGASWVWLDGQPASKKGANKFMLCSSVDGYGPWNRAFTNSKKFSEEYLGDPDSLWEEILKKFTKDEWNSVELKKQFNLHHVMSWHSRVWDVTERVVNELDGDARKIWRKGDPDKIYGEEEEYDNETILDRLEYFLYNRKKYTDTQIPKMIIGALIDSGQLEGSIDVKADTHVIRVSGRVVYGIEDLREFVGDQNMAENIAVHTARLLSPENPWYVDQQLFAPGGIHKICTLRNPKCDRCNYNSFCYFKLGLKKDLPVLPKALPSLKEFQKERGIESN